MLMVTREPTLLDLGLVLDRLVIDASVIVVIMIVIVVIVVYRGRRCRGSLRGRCLRFSSRHRRCEPRHGGRRIVWVRETRKDAKGGTRTHTGVSPLAPKASASANSATFATRPDNRCEPASAEAGRARQKVSRLGIEPRTYGLRVRCSAS